MQRRREMCDAGIVEFGQQDDALVLGQQGVREQVRVSAGAEHTGIGSFVARGRQVLLHRGQRRGEVLTEVVVRRRQFGGEIAERAADRTPELRFESGLNLADGGRDRMEFVCRRRGGCVGQASPEGVGVYVNDRLREIGFRREVVVEAAFADVGSLAQLIDADGLIAALEEQPCRREDEALAGVRRSWHGSRVGDS